MKIQTGSLKLSLGYSVSIGSALYGGGWSRICSERPTNKPRATSSKILQQSRNLVGFLFFPLPLLHVWLSCSARRCWSRRHSVRLYRQSTSVLASVASVPSHAQARERSNRGEGSMCYSFGIDEKMYPCQSVLSILIQSHSLFEWLHSWFRILYYCLLESYFCFIW